MDAQPDDIHGTGRLVLVVGPSGVGKDSLLAAARTHFSDNPAVVFPRRVITRPADAGGENHIAVDDPTFDRLLREKGLALYWDAHGLSYGIPVSILSDLKRGAVVVVNTSRAIVDDVRTRFPGTVIVSITAAPGRVAERLALRGREAATEIARRLERADALSVAGPDVVEIDNSGDLAVAEAALIAALQSLRATAGAQ